jgi:hypothetical protein
MRPRKLTDEGVALLQRQAHLRLQLRREGRTNKQLAIETGLAPGYVARLIAAMRRDLEARKGELIDVSCGTKSDENAAP